MQSQMFIQTVSELQQPGQGTAQKQAASSILLLKPDFWCKFPSVKYGVCRASQLPSAHVTSDPVKFLFPEVLSVSLPRALFLILQNGFCCLFCFRVSPNFPDGESSRGQETSQELGHDDFLCYNTFEAQSPGNCPM